MSIVPGTNEPASSDGYSRYPHFACASRLAFFLVPEWHRIFTSATFFGDSDVVLHYDGSTGAFKSTFVPFNSGGLTFPLGAAFGSDGNFYVTNSNNDTVVRYNGATGAFISTFASSVGDAAGLAFGPDHNVYVANAGTPGSVTKLNGTTGAPIAQLTGGGLSDPEGIVFGPGGNLYVANVDGNDIVRFNGTT